jgi:alpha-tubulin suppressor-like RCC1 family protein
MKWSKRQFRWVFVLVVLGILMAVFEITRNKGRVVVRNPISMRVIPRIAACWSMAAMIAPDGSLWLWGEAKDQGFLLAPKAVTETPLRIGGDKDWVKIATGSRFLIGLKRDGSLWATGQNGEGALGVPGIRCQTNFVQVNGDHDWEDIQTGARHSVALKRDGSVWVWGSNTHGQSGTQSKPLKRLEDVAQVAAGSFNSFALKRDGTIWGWGLGMEGDADMHSPERLDDGAAGQRLLRVRFICSHSKGMEPFGLLAKMRMTSAAST